MAMKSCKLSVVMIARNEADHIGRAIESVLHAVKAWPDTEVLLVDSASTDATVEIAKQYPISIVRLNAKQFLSAAAGRYIGMHHTCGEFILHLDGDMELYSGWLEEAIPFLASHPEAAGVDGPYRNVYIRDGQVLSEQMACSDLIDQPSEASFFCGAALYRRSALEAAGGFNPYLISEEEPELSIRLRHAGFKLIRLPLLLCIHYGPPENSWDYIVRRLRVNLWAGYGQVPRYHLTSGLLGTVIRERTAYTVFYLLGILLVAITLVAAILFQNAWFLAGVGLIGCGMLTGFWIKKRSLSAVFKSLLLQTFVAYSAVRGFLMKPWPPESYPKDVEVIQVQPFFKNAVELCV